MLPRISIIFTAVYSMILATTLLSGCGKDSEKSSDPGQEFGTLGHVFGESITEKGEKFFFLVVKTSVSGAKITEVRIDDIVTKNGASIFGDASKYYTGNLTSSLSTIELGDRKSTYESTLKEMVGQPFFNMIGQSEDLKIGQKKHKIEADVQWENQTLTYNPASVTE